MSSPTKKSKKSQKQRPESNPPQNAATMTPSQTERARKRVVKLRSELKAVYPASGRKRMRLEAQLDELRETFGIAPQEKPKKILVSDLGIMDLLGMGIQHRKVIFSLEKDQQDTSGTRAPVINEAELQTLCSKITCIRQNFTSEDKVRNMTFEAIFTAATKIFHESATVPCVAVTDGLEFGIDEAMMIEDPVTRTQYFLSGRINYLCCTFESASQHGTWLSKMRKISRNQN
ncbi:hypothetical protein H0H81_000642 [Sphagnurus paluster]|uniref:Uncharacterized protein n=1 Tax=Sphagnurus paluster TaxID=117069 RepID=A0A9P7FVP0_9AGAR|nr:hypothetical protein H0H81_000642 [Sphagnurus paluster]